MSYSVCFSFYMISSFLAKFQILQCAFLIFHVFHYYSTYSRSNSFFSLIFQIFHFSRHIPGPRVFISHFPRFQYFPPYSRSKSVCVKFSTFFSFLVIFQFPQCGFHIFTFFNVFCHISQFVFLLFHYFQYSRHTLGHIVCISHFPPISVFLAIFQVLQCMFLIFHDFHFSCHITDPRVCISLFHLFHSF